MLKRKKNEIIFRCWKEIEVCMNPYIKENVGSVTYTQYLQWCVGTLYSFSLEKSVHWLLYTIKCYTIFFIILHEQNKINKT